MADSDIWPRWSRRPIGRVVRTVFGLAGVVLGAAIVFLAYFGATFKQDRSDWSGEPAVLLVLGLAIIVGVVTAAIRPTKVTVAVAAAVLLSAPITGAAI